MEDTYVITLNVTLEQEYAIMKLFNQKQWQFVKQNGIHKALQSQASITPSGDQPTQQRDPIQPCSISHKHNSSRELDTISHSYADFHVADDEMKDIRSCAENTHVSMNQSLTVCEDIQQEINAISHSCTDFHIQREHSCNIKVIPQNVEDVLTPDYEWVLPVYNGADIHDMSNVTLEEEKAEVNASISLEDCKMRKQNSQIKISRTDIDVQQNTQVKKNNSDSNKVNDNFCANATFSTRDDNNYNIILRKKDGMKSNVRERISENKESIKTDITKKGKQNEVDFEKSERPQRLGEEKNSFKEELFTKKSDNGKRERLQRLRKENNSFKEELDQQITVTSLMIQEHANNVCTNTCCMCNQSFDNMETFKHHATDLCLKELMEKSSGHFKCKTCGTLYDTAFSLLNHRLSQICKPGMLVREGDMYICQYCNTKYPVKRKYEFTLHILTHRNLRSHTCTYCGKSFVRWKSLKDHQLSHTGLKPFVCRFCPLKFGSSMGRRNHELTKHTPTKSYICEVCGTSFPLKDRLAVHLKTVHTKKRYKCDVCHKELKSKISVIHHKKAHANIKSNVCDICGKAFLLKTALNAHMRRHRNERSYFCEICKKGFYKQQNLDVHMRVHTGSKPFSCSMCTYRCAVQGNLKKHVKSCHSYVTL